MPTASSSFEDTAAIAPKEDTAIMKKQQGGEVEEIGGELCDWPPDGYESSVIGFHPHRPKDPTAASVEDQVVVEVSVECMIDDA